MKDFFTLVKAISASTMSVGRSRNGKTVKPHSVSLSQILSALMIAAIFTWEFCRGLLALVAVGGSGGSLEGYLRITLAGFIGFGFFITLSFTPSIFFQTNNDMFTALPISGDRLFLARLVLSLYLTFMYGGLLFLACSLATCIILSLGILSYAFAVLISLLLILVIPCLSFIWINFLSGFVDFKTNRVGSLICNIVSGVMGSLMIMVSSFTTSYLTGVTSAASADSMITTASGITSFMSWIGFLPEKSILLLEAQDGLFFLVFVGVVLLALALTFILTRKSYLSHLGLTHEPKKRKLTPAEKEHQLEKSFARVSHPTLLFFHREMGNYRAQMLVVLTSLIYPVSLAIPLLITLALMVKQQEFASTPYVGEIIACCFMTISLYVPMFPFCAMSLEKKNIATLKSFPISQKRLTLTKLLPSVVFTLPIYAVLVVAFGVVDQAGWSSWVNLILSGLGYLSLNLSLCYYLGIVFVNFNYDAISDLLKKGPGPLLSNLLQFPLTGLVVGLEALGYTLVQDYYLGGILVLAVFGGLSFLFVKLSEKRSAKLMKEDIGF